MSWIWSNLIDLTLLLKSIKLIKTIFLSKISNDTGLFKKDFSKSFLCNSLNITFPSLSINLTYLILDNP